MAKPPVSTWFDLAPHSLSDRRRVLKGAVAGGLLLASGSAGLAEDIQAALTSYTRTFFTDFEWHAVRAGRWAYSDLMPIVPLLQVGLAPVLQWLVVPPIVVYFLRHHHVE